MPPAALTERTDDVASLRRLLAVALDPWTQASLADALGVSRTVVTGWLSADPDRAPRWHVVRAALRRTARRHPDHVPALVQALAAEFLDVHGRWVPEEQLDLLDFGAASNRVTLAHAALLEAVERRSGIETARRALIDASEACAAAARAA